MDQEMQEAPFSLDELNEAWSKLISTYLTNNLILTKKVVALQLENTDLKAKLHQTQLDLIAAQGKQAIDGVL